MATVNSLFDSHQQTLTQWLQQRGEPAYRLRQIREWLFQRGANHFDDMTNLPKQLRTDLNQSFRIWTTRIANHRRAADGTEKLLLELSDQQTIECVLLPGSQRRSICISTQVGCAMGCVFCASGLHGVERNLETHEIIEQMLRLQRLLPPDERLSHVVVMGMGEPLANLDRLLPALEEARSPHGLGISVRRITISTVGLPAAIRRLADHHVHYHLAISLHAPNDELRSRLVPINRQVGLQKIIAAADQYFEVSGRRLTFEYVLLADLNDQPEHARQLVRLLRGRSALLNVIPLNPVSDLPYRTPTFAATERFQHILEEGGLTVQFRQLRGDTIDAACGQLRRLHDSEPG